MAFHYIIYIHDILGVREDICDSVERPPARFPPTATIGRSVAFYYYIHDILGGDISYSVPPTSTVGEGPSPPKSAPLSSYKRSLNYEFRFGPQYIAVHCTDVQLQ